MNKTTPVFDVITTVVTTAGQYIADFFEELERTTGFRPQEFKPEGLRRKLRQTLNDLYRLNLGRSALQHIISICRFIFRIYNGEEQFDLERSIEIFVDILSKYVMALKSMFLLEHALFLMEDNDQIVNYFIAAMFYVFDFLCNKLIIKSADRLKFWLPILLRSCWNVAKEFYSRFSDILFIDRMMISAS